MGWFCDHEYVGSARYTGIFGGKRVNTHKCKKCGKMEDCDRDGEKYYDSSEGGALECDTCSVCGQMY